MTDTPIRFGTSGWRGVIGEEITQARATAVVQAVGALLIDEGWPRRVLIARDSRPGGARLVAAAAEALAAMGLAVDAASGVTPTPVAAHAIARAGYGAGLIFTASHNAPAYQGLKVFGPAGNGLDTGRTRRLERLAGRALSDPPRVGRRGRVREADPVPAYRAALAGALDRAALGRVRPTVHYDAMYGAGSGVLDRVLADAGVGVRVLRGGRDARFRGVGPDPVPERLAALRAALRRGKGPRLGLATDGDADRYAVVDADGRVLSATQAVALLVDHLARTGRIERGVALSVATGSLVARVARSHGLRVVRQPIGFKWLSRSLLAGDADCAGEESGGFVWRPFGIDKDGILAGALLTELVATAGVPLAARLAELERRHGPCHCGRIALPASDAARERLARRLAAPPGRIDGARVTAVDARDGLRLGLADGFLMLRGSGTEPVLRVYAEAPTPAGLAARLRRGARWLHPHASGNLAD